jgi:DNA-directed RNA polymerase specialized sigma24 family protein
MDSAATAVSPDDPEVGLRAAGALRRLAEQVEATHVQLARTHGWSWEQIGDALGVSRQSIHAKYARLVP